MKSNSTEARIQELINKLFEIKSPADLRSDLANIHFNYTTKFGANHLDNDDLTCLHSLQLLYQLMEDMDRLSRDQGI